MLKNNPNITTLTKCVRFVNTLIFDGPMFLPELFFPNMAITPPPPSEHCSDCDAHRCLWTVP